MAELAHADPEDKGKKLFSRESLATLVRIWRFAQPPLGMLILTYSLMVIGMLMGLAAPLLLAPYIDRLLAGDRLESLNQVGLFALIFFLVQFLINIVKGLSSAVAEGRVLVSIRVHIFQHLQRLSLRYYSEERTGDLISRITGDVHQLQSTITSSIPTLVISLISVTGGLIALFWLNWRMTFVVLLGVPFNIIILFYVGNIIRRYSMEIQEAIAEIINIIEESISGIYVVKSFGREEYELNRYVKTSETFYRFGMRFEWLIATLEPIIMFVTLTSLGFVVWFGLQQIILERTTMGELVAFFFYAGIVSGPLSSLMDLYTSLQSDFASIDRVFEILDTKPEIEDAQDAKILPPITGEVQFENVSFSYSPNHPVLSDISFVAKPNQVIGLVGASGAGKSTLINLIPRFYDVEKGEILIDGHDIRDVTAYSLRSQIGIVAQDIFLFPDTIYNNIKYGRLDATHEEIIAATEAANAHEFIINELESGYETLVGERGNKLSGGQKQRIAIARAILKNPPLLLLDEATSSLDTESEAMVQKALEQLMLHRTTIVIAHRLSTIYKADLILVLQHGQIVEQGRHKELIKQPNGYYKRLYKLQFKEAAEAQVNNHHFATLESDKEELAVPEK